METWLKLLQGLAFILLVNIIQITAQSCNDSDNRNFLHASVVDLFYRPISSSVIAIKRFNSNDLSSITLENGADFCVSDRISIEKLYVSAKGYLKREVRLIKGADANRLMIGLEVGAVFDTPTLTVQGHITDERKRPISNAEILAFSPLNDQASIRSVSNANGKYELRIRSPGAYILVINAIGFTVQPRLVSTAIPPTFEHKSLVENFTAIRSGH